MKNKALFMHNILLIGGAGFIGSNLIGELLRKDETSVSVLEPEFASISRIKNFPVNVFRGELSDINKVKSLLVDNHIDTIVHLVSTIIPGSTYDDYEREFTNVIFPSIRLMELCCERHIKFVYFSSGGTVYGNRRENVPFTETDNLAPISYYGWSKQMMENSILFMHRTQGLEYLILRPSNPYGHGQNLYGKQGLIAVALGKILAKEKITVWGDGNAVRDYIYIDDLCKAVAGVLCNKDVIDTTLNVGSGVGCSVNEIIDILKNVVDEDVLVEYVAARQADVSSVFLDTSRLRKIIDFRPVGIFEGITKFYNEVKASRG